MNLTELDWTQVLRSSYDDTTGRLKVDATVVATIGELEVIIRADQGDNIAIASPDGLNILQINPDGSIDANVAVSAAGGDSILFVGTEDGTTSGTQHVLRVGSDLKLEVKDVTVNTSLGSVITNQSTQIGQITTLTSLVSTANNQTNGQQKTQQVDAAGNVQPSADVISRSLFTRLSNGTTEVGITGSGEVRVLVTPLTNTSVVKSQLQDNLGNGITSQSILATRSLDVAVSQSALPAGASTSALQTTGNTSLNSIDTKLDTTNARLTSIDNDIDVTLSTRASSANQTNGTQKTQLVDPSGVSVTSQTNGTQRALDIGINVSGVQVDPRQIRALTSSDQVTIANPSIAVTGPLTDTQLRATPVPISGTITATVAGVATEATLSALNAKVTTVNTGAVTISTALPTGTNSIGQVTANAGTNLNTSALNLETTQAAINAKIPANLTVSATRLLTDGSGVTQPISAVSLPLPTGAATETTLSNIDTKIDVTLSTRASSSNQINGTQRTQITNGTNNAEVTNTNPVNNAQGLVVRTIPYEPATFSMLGVSIVPGNNKHMLSLMNNSGSTVTLKLKQIFIINARTTAVTGVAVDFRLFRITSLTAGTAVNTRTFDTVDVINASVVSSTNGTVGGLDTIPLMRRVWSSDEWGPGTLDVEANDHAHQSMQAQYNEGLHQKPITLRAGQGITLQCVTNTTAGSFDIQFIFTQE